MVSEPAEHDVPSNDLAEELLARSFADGANVGLWPGMTIYRYTEPTVPTWDEIQSLSVCIVAQGRKAVSHGAIVVTAVVKIVVRPASSFDDPAERSVLPAAPVAQLFCNLVETSHCPSGDPDHEVEALVLRRPNPLSVDGQEGPARCPRKSLVAVHQCVIPCQGLHQRGRLQMEIWVGILAEHRGAWPCQSRFKQAVVPDDNIASDALSGNV